MASRQDRMAQRLRGAQRHQVEEADFAFVLPGLDFGVDLGLDAPPDNIAAAAAAAAAAEQSWPLPELPPELQPKLQHGPPSGLQQDLQPDLRSEPQPEPQHEPEPELKPQPEPQPVPQHEEQPDRPFIPAIESPLSSSAHTPRPMEDLVPDRAPSTVVDSARQSASNTTSPLGHPASDGPTVSGRPLTSPPLPPRRTSPRLPQQRTPEAENHVEMAVDGETQMEEEALQNETGVGADGVVALSPPNHTLHDTSAKTGTSTEEIAEVQESPEDFPGSGALRTFRIPSSANSSRLLKDALVSIDNEEDLLSSSPTARVVRRSAALGRTSRGRSRSSGTTERTEGATTEIPESNDPEASPLKAPDAEATVAEVDMDLEESVPVQIGGPMERRPQQGGLGLLSPQDSQPNGAAPEEATETEASSPERPARFPGRKRRRQGPTQTLEPEPDERGPKRRRKQAPAPVALPPARRQPRATRAQQAEHEKARSAVLVEKVLPIRAGSTVRSEAARPEVTRPEVTRPEASREANEAEAQSRKQDLVKARRDAKSRAREISAAGTARGKKTTKAAKETARARDKPAPTRARAKKNGDVESIPIRVQRFSRKNRPDENNPEAIDILTADIPFSQRRTPNTIDVLNQVCHETIDDMLEKNASKLHEAPTAAERKQLKIKLRAVEAFREQLANSLLEHTIHLEKLYSLRQGVKQSLRTRDRLQDDVIRMRRERDEIKMQIEAVKARHHVKEQEARRRLDISTAMNDIDLAIEKGKAAPELTPAEQKTAGLASLEAQIARLAGHVSSSSAGGGALQTVRDFNAFLERAALALEGKGV